MSERRLLDGAGVRRMRLAAQLLHRPRRRSAVELVRHLAGVQAQVLPAAWLALGARTDGLTARAVERARVRERSVVLTWAMRGTLHLIATEDYGWLVPMVMEPGLANALRRLAQLGVPAEQPERAVQLIGQMLAREGPMVRSEIAGRLRKRGIHTDGQAIAHMMWLAAARGVVCYGPDQGHEHCFVLVADWIGEPKRRERGAALTELAMRYLKAHGPAEPADLAAWSGIRLGDAKRTWQSIADRLASVETTRGTRWTLRSPPGPAPAGLVRLIPTFDEYLMGWKDRAAIAAPDHWRQINRGGGWVHPVVLLDGEAVGTWSTDRAKDALRLRLNPFSRQVVLDPRKLAAEVRHVGAFLSSRVELAPD